MKLKNIITAVCISASLLTVAPSAQSGSDPMIGEIQWFAGNFPPRGWAFCDGQLLAISQYTALFSILGTTYGGDGRTTFALPDVRGRTLIHAGEGLGLTRKLLGQRGGAETVALSIANMPAHTHALRASGGSASAAVPTNNVLASPGRTRIYDSAEANVNMNGSSVSAVGAGLPHDNMQPYNTLNCIIALEGLYPPRN